MFNRHPCSWSLSSLMSGDRVTFAGLSMEVVHSVDATRLEDTLLGDASQKAGVGLDGDRGEARQDHGGHGRKVLFDRVVFNFPHTGKQRTHLNRSLISDFFASTRYVVSQGLNQAVSVSPKSSTLEGCTKLGLACMDWLMHRARMSHGDMRRRGVMRAG